MLLATGGLSTRRVRLARPGRISSAVFRSLHGLPGMLPTGSAPVANPASVSCGSAAVRVSASFVAVIFSAGVLVMFPALGLSVAVR